MNFKEVYINSITTLNSSKIETPELEAGVIIYSVTGRDRAYLYAHGDDNISGDDISEISRRISLRISGMPLQYITGNQEFMSLDFKVSPDVLIPRRETEALVEHVTDRVKGEAGCGGITPLPPHATQAEGPVEKRTINILDLGTGSGCIALSLLHYIPGSRAVAVDISAPALKVAAENAVRLGLEDRVKFLLGDLFRACATLAPDEKMFDVIVSNPPYVSLMEMKTLSAGIRDHEPAVALLGGTEGLDFYRRILSECRPFMKRGSIVAFETGMGQAVKVAEMMEKAGCGNCNGGSSSNGSANLGRSGSVSRSMFTDIRIIPDLGGIGRVVSGVAV